MRYEEALAVVFDKTTDSTLAKSFVNVLFPSIESYKSCGFDTTKTIAEIVYKTQLFAKRQDAEIDSSVLIDFILSCSLFTLATYHIHLRWLESVFIALSSDSQFKSLTRDAGTNAIHLEYWFDNRKKDYIHRYAAIELQYHSDMLRLPMGRVPADEQGIGFKRSDSTLTPHSVSQGEGISQVSHVAADGGYWAPRRRRSSHSKAGRPSLTLEMMTRWPSPKEIGASPNKPAQGSTGFYLENDVTLAKEGPASSSSSYEHSLPHFKAAATSPLEDGLSEGEDLTCHRHTYSVVPPRPPVLMCDLRTSGVAKSPISNFELHTLAWEEIPSLYFFDEEGRSQSARGSNTDEFKMPPACYEEKPEINAARVLSSADLDAHDATLEAPSAKPELTIEIAHKTRERRIDGAKSREFGFFISHELIGAELNPAPKPIDVLFCKQKLLDFLEELIVTSQSCCFGLFDIKTEVSRYAGLMSMLISRYEDVNAFAIVLLILTHSGQEKITQRLLEIGAFEDLSSLNALLLGAFEPDFQDALIRQVKQFNATYTQPTKAGAVMPHPVALFELILQRYVMTYTPIAPA